MINQPTGEQYLRAESVKQDFYNDCDVSSWNRDGEAVYELSKVIKADLQYQAVANND